MAKRLSDWLKHAPKGTKPCKTCTGTGWHPKKGPPYTCPNCRGFGY